MVSKAKLQEELDKATEYIIGMEEKVFKSNKISLELLKQLKETEAKLNAEPVFTVEKMVKREESPPPKLRVKATTPKYYTENIVDVKLGEFISEHPDGKILRYMFQKEKDGVFTFGSKKITMKVENNILMCRTGGGYLTIEQFVHQYLNLELEKADRIQQMEIEREEVIGQV